MTLVMIVVRAIPDDYLLTNIGILEFYIPWHAYTSIMYNVQSQFAGNNLYYKLRILEIISYNNYK